MNPTEHIGKMFITTTLLNVRTLDDVKQIKDHSPWDTSIQPGTCFILIKASRHKDFELDDDAYWSFVGLIGKKLVNFEFWAFQLGDLICLLDDWNGELKP